MNNGEVDIVLVEDNPHDAELATRVLKKHGLAEKCVLLTDGAEALDFLFAQGRYRGRNAHCNPKVIFLDLKLPKIDGLEVLRRLKEDERTRGIPVVALTSSNEKSDLKTAYAAGVNSFVTKPIEFSKFSEMVAELGKYWMELNRLPG